MRQSYPVVKRRPSEPSTRFRLWVAQFRPTRLARALGVNRSAVHSWVTVTGKRRNPRMQTVLDIVALSKIEPLHGKTKLRISDVLGEVKVSSVEVHYAHDSTQERPCRLTWHSTSRT